MRALTAVLAAGFAISAVAPAAAQFGGRDTQRIQTAIEADRIAPLRTLLEQIQTDQPIYIIEAELEEDADAPSGWLYEVELLTREGEQELEVDARTGEILDRDD